MDANERPGGDYDVVVLGGALAGASTAWLLKKQHPGLRIAVVEKSTVFTRRVGEATVEVSAFFLGRVLGLTQHLNEYHLVKQGMRFWFANGRTQGLGDSSEIGGQYQVRLAAYQVDRAILDEEVLRRATAQGVELVRPARVRSVSLQDGGRQKVHLTHAQGSLVLTARWVVDATGFAALLARQEGWYRSNDAHPTSSVWARWQGVKDWDGLELAERYPEWAGATYGIRGTATNHLMGDGWWAWFIPLKGGDVSAGVVYDHRRVQWASGESLGRQLKEFLCAHPVGRVLLEHATWQEGDVHRRSHLAHSSARYAGDGFVLVGDSAAFIDPFYSPGMDWLTYSVTRAVELIEAGLQTKELPRQILEFNRDFSRSYDKWFRAIYQDKYDYLGDFELMRIAFRLDLGAYYFGVASQPHLRGASFLRYPVFSTPPSIPCYWLIQFYNRRLAAMSRSRRHRGTFGKANHGRRFLLSGYSFEPLSALAFVKALGGWAWMELKEGWRTWFSSGRKTAEALCPFPLETAPK